MSIRFLKRISKPTSAFAEAKALHETLNNPAFVCAFSTVIPMIDGRAWKFFPIGLSARGNAVTILLKLMVCLSNSNRSVYEPHCKRKEKMSVEELLGGALLACLLAPSTTCVCMPFL